MIGKTTCFYDSNATKVKAPDAGQKVKLRKPICHHLLQQIRPKLQ